MSVKEVTTSYENESRQNNRYEPITVEERFADILLAQAGNEMDKNIAPE